MESQLDRLPNWRINAPGLSVPPELDTRASGPSSRQGRQEGLMHRLAAWYLPIHLTAAVLHFHDNVPAEDTDYLAEEPG